MLYDVEKATVDARKYCYGKQGNTLNPVTQAQTRREMNGYKKPSVTLMEVFRFYTQRKQATRLFGCAMSWLYVILDRPFTPPRSPLTSPSFLDLAFYGLGFSSASLLSTMGFDKRDNLYLALRNTASGTLILICAGALPGYWLTVLTVDKLGRKRIQIGGFLILTLIFSVLGFAWQALSKTHLLVLYVLAQFFFNFGPNATTFITPAEIFPTRVRCTGHGFSASMGKLGAVLAQVFFASMIKRGATHDNPTPWIHGVMQIFALFMFLGMLTSLLVPESRGESLERLAGEKGDVYHVLPGAWRSRAAREDVEAPGLTGGRGSAVSGRSTDGIFGDAGEKGKWWRLRQTEIRQP